MASQAVNSIDQANPGWDGDPSSASAPASAVTAVGGSDSSSLSSFIFGSSSGDSPADAAVRAAGIDPVTNEWLSPTYDNGQDPAQLAAQIRANATTFYNSQLAKNEAAIAKAHEAAGGFTADLLDPFSANIDPNSTTAAAANAINNQLAKIPWGTILLLLLVIAIVAGIHEVKTF